MFTHDESSIQHVPIRKVIPSVITTASMCCGLASIHFSLKGDTNELLKTALFAIGLAALLDTLDGRAARLLKATSRFGAVLDSLSDLVAFGVAPGLLLHQWMLKDQGSLGLAAVVAFVMCSALRLARFTSMPTQKPSRSALAMFFQGLPTPAAAGAVLAPVMLDVSRYAHIRSEKVVSPEYIQALGPALVIANTFVVAALMISRIPMFSFKKVRIRRAAVVPLLALMGLLVIAMFKDPWLTMPLIVWGYLATIPFSFAAYRKASAEIRRLEAQPVSPGVAG